MCWFVIWLLPISSCLVSHEFPDTSPCIQPTSLWKNASFLHCLPFLMAPLYLFQHSCCTSYPTASMQSEWAHNSATVHGLLILPFFFPVLYAFGYRYLRESPVKLFHRESVKASSIMLFIRPLLTLAYVSLLIRLWLTFSTKCCLRTSLLD